jgi:Tfp pilus assembly protein FimT
LVAIGIIVTFSLISIPSFIGYQRNSKLRNEARLLATNLRYAQQLAITTQNQYYVTMYTIPNNYYQLINSADSSVIKQVTLNPEIKFNLITGLTDNTVKFNATGGVVESGNIYLTNSVNTTSTLQIKPSGYVQISE